MIKQRKRSRTLSPSTAQTVSQAAFDDHLARYHPGYARRVTARTPLRRPSYEGLSYEEYNMKQAERDIPARAITRWLGREAD